MCGIAGYIGKDCNAKSVLIDILTKLEYRGYDSAGIVVCEVFDSQKTVTYKKSVGELDNLKSKLNLKRGACEFSLGVAHTRWATHGKPSVKNAHPHKSGSIYVAHNGIIENYEKLRVFLEKRGFKFNSDTDSEAIAHLLNFYYKQTNDFEKAFGKTLRRLQGAFAVVAVNFDNPGEILAGKLGSPLILGIGKNSHYIASDATAISQHTSRVVYVDDFEMLRIVAGAYQITNFKNAKRINKRVETLQKEFADSGKGKFDTYMQKEIYEQPEALTNSLRGRIDIKTGTVVLGGLKDVERELKDAKSIAFVACGTSMYGAMSAKHLFEKYAGVHTDIYSASELACGNEKMQKGDIAIFISQSGETADTLQALKKIKKQGALCLGVVNSVGSSIARLTHAGVYNHAGPEISVASTKAFTSQVAVLALIALKMAELKGNGKVCKALLKDLIQLPEILKKEIKKADNISKEIAKLLHKKQSVYFTGRGYTTPLAFEGALKMKEISYIHAEGYSLGEMKHGPIALVEKGFPVVAVMPEGELYDKAKSNLQELKSRGASIFAIGNVGMKDLKELSNTYYLCAKTHQDLQALLYAPVLQLLAMHTANFKKLNVDKPRNLAKSVTVE